MDADVCHWGFAPRGGSEVAQVLMEMTILSPLPLLLQRQRYQLTTRMYLSKAELKLREKSLGGRSVRKRLKTVI